MLTAPKCLVTTYTVTMNIRNFKEKDMNMEYKTLIKENFMNIRNVSIFHDRILSLVKTLGFDGFDFLNIDNNTPEQLVTTIPVEVFVKYEAEELWEYDIITDCLRNSSSPIFQSDVFRLLNDMPLNLSAQKQSIEVDRLLSNVGINDTYSIPIHMNRSRKKSVFSVYCTDIPQNHLARKVKVVENELYLLATSLSQFQESRPSRFFNPEEPKNILTNRQLEVLEVLAKHAVSHKDAARFLGIAPSTIEKHCKAAVTALGAVSVNNAIYLATTDFKLL
jgi:DNA-binding CsgD family transcriptional regulator